jgi:hypothetical protein
MIWRAVKILAFCFVIALGIAWLVTLSPPSATPNAQPSEPGATAQHPHNGARRLLTRGVENDLLRAGFDVQVTFIEEDDSKMIVYGKSVNRPFAHNLMTQPSFRKILHTGKFTEVTFMDSMPFPKFSQVYQVR